MYQLTTQMPTLIMRHNSFSENNNKAVEAHIPRHQDSKTKNQWNRDSKAKKARHWQLGNKTSWHQEKEVTKPRHHDSKTLFQTKKSHYIEPPSLKNHNIKIPRAKSRYIKFQWNSDAYGPLHPW